MDVITALITKTSYPISEMKHILLSVIVFKVAWFSGCDAWSAVTGYDECPDWLVANKTLPKSIEDICSVGLECPDMVELDNAKCGFGVREIKAGTWLSTEVLDSEGDKKYELAFMCLYSYMSG